METHAEVGWGEAAWVSSIAVAMVIVAVGVTFFVVLILAGMSLAQVQVLKKLAVNFALSFAASFLNLFLLFGAVFAFPAVVINSIAVTALFCVDEWTNYRYSTRRGKPRVWARLLTYSLIAIASTIAGACLVKYTPGVLHKAGEVPRIEWHKDFQTWEGLGGWLAVNLGFGSVSLVVGTLAETWFFRRDAEEFLRREACQKSKAE